MSGQMTVRLPDGTVARSSGQIPTPLYDATLNSDPGRFLWLVGLGPYPGPLPKPPQEDTEDSASGAAQEITGPASPPAGDGQPGTAPGAGQDAPEATQEADPLEPLPEPAQDVAQMSEPRLDPLCRGGNHGGCVGPPGSTCECPCHGGGPRDTRAAGQAREGRAGANSVSSEVMAPRPPAAALPGTDGEAEQ